MTDCHIVGFLIMSRLIYAPIKVTCIYCIYVCWYINMRVFFVCLLKNGSASASSTSGFMDQYFGGEFDVLYPFILIVLNCGIIKQK